MIAPSQTHDDVIEYMCPSFPGRLPEAWPHDINGERLFDFDDVVDSERILVGTTKAERVRAETEMKVTSYLGDVSLPKVLCVCIL